MKKQSGKTDNPEAKSSGKTLRQLAEVIVQEKASEQLASEASMSPEQLQGTLHELRVHQIELEMQNEELRSTQTELMEMKERYFNLYDLAPVGYLTISDKGIIMRANLTACTMLGADRRELIKKRFSEYIAIDDLDVYYLKMKMLVETGIPQQYDLRLSKKEGIAFWAHLSLANTTDSGYPVGYSVVITDASERKSIEFSLKESRERYKGLFEYSGIGIGYYSPDGVVISYNRKALENLGGELDDFVGKPFNSIFPKTEADIYMGRLKEALSSSVPKEYEDRLNLGRGTLWFSSTFTKVIDDDGEAVGVQIASLNITERKNAEVALKESEEKYRRLVTQMEQGLAVHEVILDEQGRAIDYRFIDVNPSFEKLTGLKSEDILGKTVLEVLPGTEQYWIEKYGQVALTGIPLICENYASELKKWYEVVAYATMPKQFATVFNDITDRKQIEEQLKQQNKDLLESQRVAHVGTWRLDIETDQVEWSNELYKMYGFDPTLPPPPYSEHMKLFTPESWIELSTSLERTSTLGIPYELELQTVTKDGSNGWMWVRGEASRNSNGIITSLWGAARDITESKKAEAAIKESEEKFRYLFENSSVGKSLTQPSGEINANVTFCRMLGYTAEELRGKRIQELTHPDDIELTELEMNELISGEKREARFNKRYIRKDGSIIWAEVMSTVRRRDDGSPMYFMTSIIDITDRIKIQEALKQSEKLFRTSFESATVGGVMVAKDGAFIEVNDKACELWGYGREELLQLRFTDITFSEDLVESIDLITNLLSGRADNLTMEKRYVKKDGSLIWGLVSVSAIRDDNDEFEYFLAYIQNITEIKESENNLKYLSYHDQLTGLYNRRFFEEELSRLDAKRNLPISLIMADINGLKIINDSFGHDVGDDYLIKLAEVIKTTCRADEIIARLGGDEFVIILPNTGGQETASIINRLKDTISKTKNGSFELSVSFGHDTKEREEQPISDIIANAENHMYTHKIVERASMRSKTVEMIMGALFEKSGREALHSKRVSKICEEIAVKMNFDRDDIEQIRIAGLVHDIGKIGIDEAILNKTEQLESQDWPAIRKHPEAGWRILNTTIEFSEVAQFVLNHHEKFDGSGYPNGLKGEEIPIQARIIAIADAYDAMTNVRSYRKAISHEEAIEELKRCSGTHFDPSIVDAFLR